MSTYSAIVDQLQNLQVAQRFEEDDFGCHVKFQGGQSRFCDLSWKEYARDKRHHQSGCSWYPDLRHKVTMEGLLIDSRHHSAPVCEDPQKRGRLEDIQLDEQKKSVYSDKWVDFYTLLRACAMNSDLNMGTIVHCDVVKAGMHDTYSDALVTMYAKCGALSKAEDLLHVHGSRNVFSWNAVIIGYARQGQGKEALHVFEQMQHEGLSPDAVTYACVLKACGSIGALDKGEQIHHEISRKGLMQHDVVLGTMLVDMYCKCGALATARQILQELPARDVVSWSVLIAGYAQQGQGEQALDCFEHMQHEGLSPDSVTFTCILKACGSIGALDKGQQVHNELTRQGLVGNDIMLGTALVDMYAKCGAMDKARQVLAAFPLRNVVCWGALIAGYAQKGQGWQALECYKQMLQEGLVPDEAIFTCLLKACGRIGAADNAKQIHDEITKQGLLRKSVLLGTALMDMYANCGALSKARQVLEQLPCRDIVSWSILIAAYAQQGQGDEAIICYDQMQCEGFSPDAVTFTCLLKACGSLRDLQKGEQIHDEISRRGLLEGNLVLGNALVDMYAKCGALEKAQCMLVELPYRDDISWTSLISGYAQQGQCEEVLSCIDTMWHEGIAPNAATFLSVLNACSQKGLVDDGHMYFLCLSTTYGVKPDLEHYSCMIDLFGRAGQLGKAVEVVQQMESCNEYAVWSTLLGACEKWGDIHVGQWAFEQAVQVNKSEAAAYVLMANIYTSACMHKEAKQIAAMRLQNKA